jgi:hypothetical protein
MVSIRTRAAAVGAAVAMIGIAGPTATAGAATFPPAAIAPGPIAGAFQAGAVAALGGWNAGADAAVGGWNAGLAAMGAPFQLTVNTGPFGLHGAGIAAPTG